MVKEGYSVCIQVSRPNLAGRMVKLGLELREPKVVDAFGSYARHIWDTINPADREKRHIVGWLRQLVARLEAQVGDAKQAGSA